MVIILQIIRDLVVTGAAVFTAWWAYKTFAHNDKIKELKRFLSAIDRLGDVLFLMAFSDETVDEEYHRATGEFMSSSSELIYVDNDVREYLQSVYEEIMEIVGRAVKSGKHDMQVILKREYQKSAAKANLYIYSIRSRYIR